MKKILLFASALAGLFLAGSCQRENLEPMESANTVTYTVTVPDALATKGIGDDVSNVNTLHYEVYRTAVANDVDFTAEDRLLYHKTATAQSDGTFKIELELVNDQNFTVLFWAQVGETNEAYDVEDLTEVTIQTPINANQVDYAAFSGVDFIKATEKLASKTVQLTRPIAQINLGTTKASLEAFDTDINVNKSSMTVAGLSNTFYVAKQAASDAFTSTTVYNEQNVLADSLEVNGTKYVNAGMNYVGFASTVGTPVTVSYVINTTEGDIANTIENVPVKPNFRTNIIGNLITSKTDYTIELLDTWYTPEEVVEVFAVDTAEELQEALVSIQSGAEGNIVLEGDIDLNDLFASLTKAGAADSQSITIPAGVELTVDLNGYTLTGVDETETSFGLITNKGNLTIVNSAEGKTGKIKLIATKESGWSRYSSVISTQPGSTLTVGAGVEIEHLGGTSMSYGIDVLTNGKGTSVVAVIDGATVKSTYRAIRQFLNGIEANNSLTVKSGSVIESTKGNKSIWMQDPSEKPNSGKLVVEAGAQLKTDAYLDVDERSTEWPIEVSIAASALVNGAKVVSELPVGYSIAETDGVWTVSRDWSVNPEQTEYTIYTANGLKWVADVVNNTTPYTPTLFDGKTVKLMNDIDLKNEEWIPIGDDRSQRTEFHGVFDGQGHTVKNVKITKKTDRDDENKSSYGLFGNLKGTVKNLTVENVSISGAPKFIGALVGRMNDGLIENCHVKNSSVECNNWTIGGLVGQLNNGKISGCTVEGTTIKGYAAVGAIAGIALNKGERVIEDCSVKNCTILQNGSFGYGNYDEMFGAIVGALYSGELTVNLNACSVENTTIKDVTSTELCGFVSEGDKLVVDGYEILAPGLGYDKEYKTYAVSSAEGLVVMSNTTIKAGESVVLTADIDLAGVEFNGLSAFNSENPNTFDGQDHVVSNWTNEKGASDMGFIKSWVGTIKNLTIKNASLKTNGRSAIIAANTYCNIENCHVVNCTLEDSYWACGLIAGLYNSGSVSNCSATNSSVKSNGGTAAIVGVVNETAGTRSFTNCVVTGCTVNNTGVYGEGYSAAMVCGVINISNSTVKFAGCELSNNTKLGKYVGDLYYSSEGNNVVVE